MLNRRCSKAGCLAKSDAAQLPDSYCVAGILYVTGTTAVWHKG
jgi:hypothetical protein